MSGMIVPMDGDDELEFELTAKLLALDIDITAEAAMDQDQTAETMRELILYLKAKKDRVLSDVAYRRTRGQALQSLSQALLDETPGD